MEIQWSLVIFAAFICWGAGTYVAAVAFRGLLGASERIMRPAFVLSAVAVVVGGGGVHDHLGHLDRIFGVLSNPASGIFVEGLSSAVLVVVAAAYLVAAGRKASSGVLRALAWSAWSRRLWLCRGGVELSHGGAPCLGRSCVADSVRDSGAVHGGRDRARHRCVHGAVVRGMPPERRGPLPAWRCDPCAHRYPGCCGGRLRGVGGHRPLPGGFSLGPRGCLRAIWRRCSGWPWWCLAWRCRSRPRSRSGAAWPLRHRARRLPGRVRP